MSKAIRKMYKRIAHETTVKENSHLQTTFIPAISLQNLTNERTINLTVDNTFEEIDSFSKLITIFEIFRQEKYIEPCKI